MICNTCKFPHDDYIGMHMEDEECPQCDNLYPKVKQWFSDIADADLDSMVNMGAVSRDWVIKQYIKENHS